MHDTFHGADISDKKHVSRTLQYRKAVAMAHTLQTFIVKTLIKQTNIIEKHKVKM